ncbi:MAG TPA: hypothetical protein PKE31_18770 [Pseudomonadota bacterium]|jgi:hypothetical protein|nr:hypothetical protein [Pseudomonadota bacterium]
MQTESPRNDLGTLLQFGALHIETGLDADGSQQMPIAEGDPVAACSVVFLTGDVITKVRQGCEDTPAVKHHLAAVEAKSSQIKGRFQALVQVLGLLGKARYYFAGGSFAGVSLFTLWEAVFRTLSYRDVLKWSVVSAGVTAAGPWVLARLFRWFLRYKIVRLLRVAEVPEQESHAKVS